MVNATISPRPITANGTTQYTITLTASDPNGGNNIGSLYAHINLQGPNSGTNRGYIGWDVTRAAPAVFPNWTSFKAGSTPAGCTGSGRAAINSGSGDQYINIISCSAPSVVGNTRVINIVVTFNTNFTTPTTNNTISGYVRDFTGLQDTPAWNAFGTFDLAGSNTLTLLSSSNPSLTNQNVTFTGNAPANCAGTWWQWWVDGIQTTTVDTSNTLTPSYTRTWTTAGSHTVQFRGWNRGPCYTPTVRTSNIVTQVINPGVTTYSVSGNIYIDIDGSKTKNGSEVNYVANPSDISIDGAASTFNNGTYTFGNLASGKHTVQYFTETER